MVTPEHMTPSDSSAINPVVLAPSILAGDHANLCESANAVQRMGLSWVHLDIMDGHFVPNLSFGPQAVADLRKSSQLFFDTHLMLERPDRFIVAFAESGANLISIHVEPDYPVMKSLKHVRELGCQNGIVLNPDTPAESALPYLEAVDLVLLMTVQPGFGGQAFREDVLPKIETIHAWRAERNLDFRIEVDGGINLVTAALCRERGCDTFVAGTAFFKSDNRRAFADEIQNS